MEGCILPRRRMHNYTTEAQDIFLLQARISSITSTLLV